MASYLFQNVKTQSFKVINSKDAATAKRVYSNSIWVYVKPVPKQKEKSSKLSSKDLLEAKLLSRVLVSQLFTLRDEAREYNCRFAQLRVSNMEDTLSKLQRALKVI